MSIGTVPVHRFPWLTSHNLFHVHESMSIQTPDMYTYIQKGASRASGPPHFCVSGTCGRVQGSGRWKLKRARPMST